MINRKRKIYADLGRQGVASPVSAAHRLVNITRALVHVILVWSGGHSAPPASSFMAFQKGHIRSSGYGLSSVSVDLMRNLTLPRRIR